MKPALNLQDPVADPMRMIRDNYRQFGFGFASAIANREVQ